MFFAVVVGALTASTRLFSAPLPSLYEEAERGLTERGQFEARLAGETPSAELAASDSPVSSLRDRGVARIDGALSRETAEKLRVFVAEERRRSEDAVTVGRVPRLSRFADVLLKKNRADVLLPLDDAVVVKALRELFRSPLGETIEAVLGGGSVLRECSCLVADPGAPRQVAHPDTPWRADPAALLTCFVSLQPVELDMGPTLFFPGTHSEEAHAQFFHSDEAVKDDFIRRTPTLVSTLGVGDVSIFDSRTIHCGTANVHADRSRYLFYVSFLDANVRDPGNPGSIRPCYDNVLTFDAIRSALASPDAVPPLFTTLSEDDFRAAKTPPPPAAKITKTKKKNPKKKTTSPKGFGGR